MLGSTLAQRQAPPLAGPAPVPQSASGRQHSAGIQADHAAAPDLTPWVLVGLLGLYLLWAVIERHQRVRDQVQPRNLAVNLRNLAAIILPVILGIALLRILLVKLKVWTSNVPYVGPLIASLIQIVG